MRPIDADALMQDVIAHSYPLTNAFAVGGVDDEMFTKGFQQVVDDAPTIDVVPVKFIDEVIEYLTKCRDYAQHEACKAAWDEQRQTLIMLLHEWAAWNECGRTGKYGEWSEK